MTMELEVAGLIKPEVRTISFDEPTHKYKDEHQLNYTSVTTLIGQVEPDYDSVYWAVYRALDKAHYRPRPFVESKEIEIMINGKRTKCPISFLISGVIPVTQATNNILAMWEVIKNDACIWGTSRHQFLEDCINGFSKTTDVKFEKIQEMSSPAFALKITNIEELNNSPLKDVYPFIYLKLVDYVNKGWIIYAEKRVYHHHYRIAGTIDVLLVKNGHFIILDWKTNKEKLKFVEGYYKKAWDAKRENKIKTSEFVATNKGFNAPLQHIPHCKGEIYTLQLSLYSLLCEAWGLKCHGIILCHFRPLLDAAGNPIVDETGNRVEHAPEVYTMNYRKADCIRLLNWHYNNIINQ